MFSVDRNDMPRFTLIPDSFICEYLPAAPGNYVKIYIYLLMISRDKGCRTSAEHISRAFGISENEVVNAIKYWEGKRLLDVFFKSGKISGIKFVSALSESAPNNHRLGSDRVMALMKGSKEAQSICYICEQYLGRPLTPTDISTILYFYAELGFSPDLCEYLVEYCVLKGHTGIRYIEKVGLEWHKNKYASVDEVKSREGLWSKIHFDVLKAFGIGGRNPVDQEIKYIDKWYKDLCFSYEIISEACSITLAKTGKQSFKYADSILKSWHEAGVKTLDDVKKINEEFREKKKSETQKTSKNKNLFLNFEQRGDDLSELEEKLDQQFADQT